MVGGTKKRGWPLSKTQQRVWGYLLGYLADHGYMPTRMEIAMHLGYTPEHARRSGAQAVNSLLEGMAAKGYITIEHRKWRGIKLRQRG